MADFEKPDWPEDIKKATRDIEAVAGFFRALAGYFGISFDFEKEGCAIGRVAGYLSTLASQENITTVIAGYFEKLVVANNSQNYDLETVNLLIERHQIIANRPLPGTIKEALDEVAARTEFFRKFTKADFPLESLIAMALYWPSFRRKRPLESIS